MMGAKVIPLRDLFEELMPSERERLVTMSNQVAEMYQSWPEIAGKVLNHDRRLNEHERRIVGLESRSIPPSDEEEEHVDFDKFETTLTGHRLIVTREQVMRWNRQEKLQEDGRTLRWFKKNAEKIATHALSAAAAIGLMWAISKIVELIKGH